MTLPGSMYSRQYITKAGQKRTRYYCRFVDWKGVKRVFPAGDNLTYAKQARDYYLYQNSIHHDFDVRPKVDKQVETLRKWLARWFTLRAGKKSLDKDRIGANRLLNYFTRGEGDIALTEITSAKVEEYKLARAGERDRYGRLPKPATINRELALLRALLRMASDQDALIKVPKIRLLPEHNERHRTATEKEFRLLLKTLAHRPEVCDALEILWEQGLRESEVVGLKWTQVDLQAQVFRFPPGSKKEKSPHEPPLSPRSYEILVRRWSERTSEYVFTTPRYNQPMKPRWFKRLVSNAMVKAGIKGLWVHDLRGTFISRKVIDEGFDRKLVKVVTGHATDYAFERYLRPTREQAREMLRGKARPVVVSYDEQARSEEV